MKRKVYLDGEIGEKFGKELTINANSFSDVFRCVECNYPNFRQYLIECVEKNVGFCCEVAGSPLKSEKELLLQYREGDMFISTVPAGSKSGGAKILAAVAIVALTFATGGFAYAPSLEMMASSFGSVMAGGTMSTGMLVGLSLGVNLALTGVQQMMAPDPSVDNDQDESYLFQGTGQTIIEGDPVPVLYGKMRVPGRPISFQTRNERLNYYDSGGVLTDSPADTPAPIPVPGPPEQDPNPPSPIRDIER